MNRLKKPLGNDILLALNDPALSDICLKVENRTIYAHKVVLASRSEYFNCMFQHDFKEKQTGEIEIDGVKYEEILDMLHKMYSDLDNDSLEKGSSQNFNNIQTLL